MLLALGAALAALHAPAAPVQLPDSARRTTYDDAAAAQLVQRARERRRRVESGIEAYQATGRRRVYAGLRVTGRSRTLYTQETAARIFWRRGGSGEVVVLGAREAVPVSHRGARLPDDVVGPGSEVVELAFHPDHLQLGLQMSVQRDSSRRDSSRAPQWSILDPLGNGSEAHYRFAAGDSITLRLPEGRVIQLRELRVVPRRADYRLLRGSLWLDQESHGLVRGVFTLARPFDLVRDARGEMPGMIRALGAVRARLDRMTFEYGLIQGRWWLPHRVYLDATAEFGALGSYPVRYEQTYSGYRVQGSGQSELPPLPLPAGAVTNDSVRHCVRGENCRSWRVHATRDTAALLASEELQPSLAAAGEVMATDLELADLGRVLQRASGIGVDPTPRLDMPDLASFRHNRVEGSSFGVSATAGVGRWSVQGRGRMGLADLEPAVELGISRVTLAAERSVTAYRRLSPFDLYAPPSTLGSALHALVLGRDETDYLRASGVEITSRPRRAGRWEAAWRLFGEHQHPVRRQTDLSLSRAWDDSVFPQVRPAGRADQVGAVLTVRTGSSDPYGGLRRELVLNVDAQGGSFEFIRASGAAGVAVPLPWDLGVSLSAASGTSAGDLPVQGLWYIGGPGSVRGFRTAALGGESFWRARVELTRGTPAARLAAFSDAGWAGERGDLRLDPSLLSAGIGLATLDGLLRMDVARPLRGGRGWRADLHLSGSF